MPTRSTSRIGGYGALAVAIFTGLFFFCLMLASRLTVEPETVVWPHVISDYALALIGLCGLAAVPAITARVAAVDRELAKWASTIAQLGFGVLTVLSLWQAEYETSMAVESVDLPALSYELPDATESTSFLENVLQRLPKGWLEVAGVGFWMFIVSMLARRRQLLPAGVVRIGFAAGVFALLASFGAAAQLPLVAALGQVVFSVLLAPFWFLWMGSLLLEGAPAPEPAVVPAAPEAPPAPAAPRRRSTLVPALRRLAHRMPSLN